MSYAKRITAYNMTARRTRLARLEWCSSKTILLLLLYDLEVKLLAAR